MIMAASPVLAAVINVGPGQSIQAAIEASVNGDEIVVARGTYKEAIDFLGKAVRLHSSAGPVVTIIDGDGANHVVQCVTGESPDTILDGFTITGGSMSDNGGGMYNYQSSPTVTNCAFSGNSAVINGGGMYNAYSGPNVTNCTFSRNSATYGGGGMYNHWSSPNVTNCVFSENYGGGMCNMWYCYPIVLNCTFRGNHGSGMLNVYHPRVIVINCTFSGNRAYVGGGMHNWHSSSTLVNCTFSGNSANYGGGVFNEGGTCTLTLANCILWGNTGGEIHWQYPISVYNSDIQGSALGGSNIDADPLFVRSPSDGEDGWIDDPGTLDIDESANNDYGNLRLSVGSPCIDAGHNSMVSSLTDFGGGSRISGPAVDMGAYELQPESR